MFRGRPRSGRRSRLSVLLFPFLEVTPMAAALVLAMKAMCAMAIAVDRLPRYPS